MYATVNNDLIIYLIMLILITILLCRYSSCCMRFGMLVILMNTMQEHKKLTF